MFNLVAMVNLKLVKSLKKKSFSLVLHVLKGGGRGDQVRVPDKKHIVVVVVVVVVVMVVVMVVVVVVMVEWRWCWQIGWC